MWDRFLSILSLGGSLLLIILVLVLTYFVTRWYARRMGPSIGGRYVKIIDRSTISGSSALVIARISGRYYLLGVSEKEVNLLCELPDFNEEPSAQAAPASFQKIFRDFLDKSKVPEGQSSPHGEDGDEQ